MSRIEQLRDTVLDGATTNTYTTALVSTKQRPRRRPSKATARTSRAHHPPPPLLSSQWKQKQIVPRTVPRRRRHPSDSDNGGGLATGRGARNEDAVEKNLISSILPSRYARDAGAEEATLGNGDHGPDIVDASGRGVEKAGASPSGQPAGRQTTSAALAPFHGPLPAPLAFDDNSSSDKRSMVDQRGRDASAGGGGGSKDAVAAKDVANDSFLTGGTVVVGIPAKHRRTHAKVFQQQQRSLAEKQQQQQPLQLQLLQQHLKQNHEQQQQHRTQQQQQQQRRFSTKGAYAEGVSVHSVPVVVPSTTWNDATNEKQVEGDGAGGPKGLFSGDVEGGGDDNASGGDTDEDSVPSAGKTRVAACSCSQGGGSSEGRGNAGTREFEFLTQASEQQRRVPRTEHPAATARAYRDYHTQPPLPMKLDVAPVPLNSSSAASIDTATQQAGAPTSSAGLGGVGRDTSSPPAGMTLPWRDSRRQGPIPFPASGAGKAGTNHRRLRREQARVTGASAASSEGGATRRNSGWRWGVDGGGAGAGSGGGGGGSGGLHPSAAGVTKNAIGGAVKKSDGGNNSSSSSSGATETHTLIHSSPVVFSEWGERSRDNTINGGDTGLQGFTGLDQAIESVAGVSSAATTATTTAANSGGPTFLIAPGVAGGSDIGGEDGARSGAGNSKAGWRAAGSLANLKARMGARYQQHPTVTRERGFSAGRERNAVNRGDRERGGRAQPIAYQAF